MQLRAHHRHCWNTCGLRKTEKIVADEEQAFFLPSRGPSPSCRALIPSSACEDFSSEHFTDVLNLSQTDRQTLSYTQANVERERGQSAAPPTSWPHEHDMTRSLEQQVDFLDDFSYPCIFISHAWSSFHRCRANLRFSALRANFIDPNHHIYM